MNSELKKYRTRCKDIETGELLHERIFEAENEKQADQMAYNACLEESCDDDFTCDTKTENKLDKRYNLKIEVEEIM